MVAEDIVEELRAREPIFHRPHFAGTRAAFEQMMVEDYWEVGASGRRYDRAFILEHLAANPPVDAEAAGWICSELCVREVGPATFLVTYLLKQGERLTRRATVWRRGAEGWQILYHQGTLTA